VAIEYDDGETHIWRLVKDVVVVENFRLELLGALAGQPPAFDLHICGKGDRSDMEAWPLTQSRPEISS
jgi:hypothetical protein